MTPVLSLENVTLEYPDGVDSNGQPQTLKALDSITFQADKGSFTAVVGASGSGKSSLLSVAATLIQPTSGKVFLNGQETSGLKDSARTRLRGNDIGIIFQQPNLLPALTSEEQLVAMAHLAGARGKELKDARARAAELLDVVGLADMRNRRPHQLSGGQRQRVNIARALMGNPSLLLADEPTSALDHERSASIVALLAQLTNEFQLATVMVTHDSITSPAIDAVFEMKDGRGYMMPSTAKSADAA